MRVQTSPVEEDVSSLQDRVGEQTHAALSLLLALHLRKRRGDGRTTTRARERERERERERGRTIAFVRLHCIFDYFIYFLLLYYFSILLYYFRALAIECTLPVVI